MFNGKDNFGLWKYKKLMQLEFIGLDYTILEVPVSFLNKAKKTNNYQKSKQIQQRTNEQKIQYT